LKWKLRPGNRNVLSEYGDVVPNSETVARDFGRIRPESSYTGVAANAVETISASNRDRRISRFDFNAGVIPRRLA